jgi:ATP-dependent RNA helicase DeaD
MLSMGFLEDVSRIMSKAPNDCQTLLFSATVEEKIKRLVAKFLNDPLDVMLSTDTDRVEGITNILYESSPDMHRVRALMAIIDKEQPGTTIIFCNTREDTTTVANFLSRQGLDTQMLSGDLPQNKRTQVMQMVRDGIVQFLVATDVAARGIDVSDITHVINYSLPFEPPVFMHRIGRTGRIGRDGIAISLVGGPDIATRKVLETQFGIEFEERKMPTDEEASGLRVERQVASIKKAAGRTAFEAYLPLVRALKERPDGDVILATALRTFFQWDREQRTSKAGLDSSSAAAESRRERGGSRDGGGGRGGRGGRNRGGRDRDRGPRDDAPRKEAKSDDSSDSGNKRRRRSRNRNRRKGGGDSDKAPASE